MIAAQIYFVPQNLSCFYCSKWPCLCPITLGTRSCPPNAAPSRSCLLYSPRIVSPRTEFDTALDHWTVLDAESAAEMERVAEDNRKYLDEVLVKHPEWGAFFRRFEDMEVGAKIGEGGQAEIFEASSMSFGGLELVAKAWKGGVSVRDLERQWPPRMLWKEALEWMPFRNIHGGAFIRDGQLRNRFAFVERRHWGDLRTMVDEGQGESSGGL